MTLCPCGRRLLAPNRIRCAECRDIRQKARQRARRRTPEGRAKVNAAQRRRYAQRRAERARKAQRWADILAAVAKRRAA